MDLNQVMKELDLLFTEERMSEVPEFLETHIEQAKKEDAQDILLTLYNECIGFFRETGQYDLSIENCHKAIDLMDKMGLQDTIPYATTLLNAANAHRAAGLLEESLALYGKVRPIYVAQLKEDDMYFAGLYNNLSLLYQEMGNFEAAKEQLENALHIVAHKPDTQFEVAVTQANLANTCIELRQDDEAKARAEEAIRIFEEIGVDDAHYSAALSALGSLYFMDKDYKNALEVMEKSRECVAKYLGADNIQYQRLSDNIKIIKEKMMAAETDTSIQEQEKTETQVQESAENAPELQTQEDVVAEEQEQETVLQEEDVATEEETQASYFDAEEDLEMQAENTDFDAEEDLEMQAESADFDAEENLEIQAEGADFDAEEDLEIQAEGADFDDDEDLEIQAESAEQDQAQEEVYDTQEEAKEYKEYNEENEDIAQKEKKGSLKDEDTAINDMIAKVMDEIAVEVGEDEKAEEGAQDKSHKKGNKSKPQSKMMVEKAIDIEEIDEYLLQESAEHTAKESNLEEQEEIESDNDYAEDAEAQTNIDLEEFESENEIESETEQEFVDEYEDLTPEISGLELCRRYYEEFGKPMIAEKFHAYESVIAVGLVGKGSDCFGYDDVQSQDHDFGPRFIMWVTKKVYDEIGKELEEAYKELPDSFMGIDRIETYHGKDRAGVMIIEDFYKNVLGFDLIGALLQNNVSPSTVNVKDVSEVVLDKENLATIKSWLAVHDYALAAAVNGAVFRDDEGIFTSYRNKLLAYYPKAVWYRKIANTCALFSQNGQYNLPRMRKRGQLVAAEMAKAECMKHAMKLYYLLNRTYAPHDKWLFKGMPQNPEMSIEDINNERQDVVSLIEKISILPVDKAHETELVTAIEMLAVIFANTLERQNIIGRCDPYLDACTTELVAKSDALLTAIVADTPVTTALSLSIAKVEFEAFDKVKNEGGRASCQNNWPTFKVMRMSQYMTWSEDMLLQYLYEFKANYARGRNMIEEKYARMMESTAPLDYVRFAHKLPPVSDAKKAIIEQIVALQVKWMEEFAAQYPNLAGNARTIHTTEDLPYDTSYETYLRGELGTYSDRMLDLYGRYIVEYAKNNKNVAREIMENTIHFYGYSDLESANEKNAKFY